MKFPLKVSPVSDQIPNDATCSACAKNIGEIEGFIRLTTGAILYSDKKRTIAGPSEKMDSIFSLWYHGPHPVTTTSGDGRAIIGMNTTEYNFDIVEPVLGGQVDIHFCSTSCLSSFFTKIVSQFDTEIRATEAAEQGAAANP